MSNQLDTERSGQERMKEAVGERSDEAMRELAKMAEDGKLSPDNLLAIQFSLEGMRRAAQSPEALAAYCREQVLGVDAAALREKGFDLDAPEATRAQSEAAKKAQKEVRALLDAILAQHGPLEDTKREATLREEFERMGTPGRERVAGIHDETVERINGMNLSPDLKASFLGRALEARRTSEEALAAIENPDARLAKSLGELADRIQALNEAILLTARSTESELPGISVGVKQSLAESPMSKLVENPTFRAIEDSLLGDIRAYFENSPSTMNAVDRMIAATAAVGLTAAVVGMPMMISDGHTLSAEMLGAYMTANLAVAAAAGWTLAGGNFLRRTFSSIRAEIGAYGDALAGATGRPAAEVQKLPDTTVTTEADDARRRAVLQAASAGQRSL